MNEEKHLVTVHSSISDEVKEFYIDDKTLNYLKKNVFKTPTPIVPKEKYNVDSDDLLLYIKHVKYQIF